MGIILVGVLGLGCGFKGRSRGLGCRSRHAKPEGLIVEMNWQDPPLAPP